MWLGKGKGVTYSEALFHFLTFQPRLNILNIATIYVLCIGLVKVNVTLYQEMEVCQSSNCIIRMHLGLYVLLWQLPALSIHCCCYNNCKIQPTVRTVQLCNKLTGCNGECSLVCDSVRGSI